MHPALINEALVSSPPHPADSQLSEAIRFARCALRKRYGLSSQGSPILSFIKFDKVNITLRRAGRLRASMSGRGPDMEQAIAAAIDKCSRDARFGAPVEADEVESCVIELWIQLTAEPLDVRSPRELERGLVLGIHGVEISLNGRSAYYKPSVPLTSDLSTPENLLDKLCVKAGLAMGAWREEEAAVHRTEWLHIVEAPAEASGYRRLRRLRSPDRPSLDRESIGAAACAAASRLVAGQDGDGCFLYRYDPLKDRSESGRFSSVRHAGCSYALAWLGAWLGETAGGEFTWSAARALAKLLRQARSFPGHENALYIAEGSGTQGRLGTAALTLLALQFDPLDTLFEEHRHGLCQTVLALQDPAGWFEPSVNRDHPRESNQDYYPGEALAALGRELSRGREERIVGAFARAFPYYREYFRRHPTTAFILWQADAWRLFDEYSTAAAQPSPYASFVFEMADWLLSFQYTPENSPFPEFAGGFPRPATARYSSACYTEAIARACGVALRHGEIERALRYRAAARSGLSFVRRLQAGPESAFLFPRPELATGGITANLSTFAMRSDFDQHAITAYLAALEVSREWPEHAILDA